MKKLILLFAFVLMFSLVSAVPPQTPINTANGITIEYPQYEFAKANTTFDLHTHVYNISTGLLLTNTTTDCYVHLYNPHGSHIYNQEMNFSTNGVDFEAEIPDTVFAMLGTNAYILSCNSSVVGGFASGSFTVTNSGLTITDTMINLKTLFIAFLFLLGCLFFIGFLKSEKIQVKWSMFIVGFMFILASLNVLGVAIYDNLTSPAVINFTDSLTGILFITFWISFAILAIMWFLTLLQAILFKKSMKHASKFGGMME